MCVCVCVFVCGGVFVCVSVGMGVYIHKYICQPKLRLMSTKEQVMESMETVLLLGRSGTGKTICIANKMQADRRVAPGTSQVTQFTCFTGTKVCRLIASSRPARCIYSIFLMY